MLAVSFLAWIYRRNSPSKRSWTRHRLVPCELPLARPPPRPVDTHRPPAETFDSKLMIQNCGLTSPMISRNVSDTNFQIRVVSRDKHGRYMKHPAHKGEMRVFVLLLQLLRLLLLFACFSISQNFDSLGHGGPDRVSGRAGSDTAAGPRQATLIIRLQVD